MKQKEENTKMQQKLNYIDRNIDKYSRLELGSIDTENAEKYHNKRLQWQEYKEKFKQDHTTTFSDIIEAEKIRQQEFIKSKVVGHIVNGVEIQNVSKHLVDRVRQREIELDDIVDTLKNPLKCGKIELDDQDRPSFKTIGEKTTLYINPESGIITTVHKTHTSTAKKLKGMNDNATKN